MRSLNAIISLDYSEKSARLILVCSRSDSSPDGSWRNYMHKQTALKELYDPFAHYTRGVLYFDEERYTFTAYRTPYQALDKKTWKTERAFTADYNRLIASKYSS